MLLYRNSSILYVCKRYTKIGRRLLYFLLERITYRYNNTIDTNFSTLLAWFLDILSTLLVRRIHFTHSLYGLVVSDPSYVIKWSFSSTILRSHEKSDLKHLYMWFVGWERAFKSSINTFKSWLSSSDIYIILHNIQQYSD